MRNSSGTIWVISVNTGWQMGFSIQQKNGAQVGVLCTILALGQAGSKDYKGTKVLAI
jgi:hypothetical protein